LFTCKLAVVGATTTLGATGGGMIMITAEPDADGEIVLVAVTVTVGGVGTEAGARYAPEAEIVPMVGFPPTNPLTDQVTVVVPVPVTKAVNCCPEPVCTLAVAGDTVTLTPGGDVTCTVADPKTLGLLALVAVTVTVFGNGTAAGAV
jgi:hypothetical protein